jgi:site-specific DNA-methyltransferase (adenine-specific)
MIRDILHGDCLELMKDIPNGSVDMILADLPYGTTACKWDTIIPFEKLWEQYERVIKPNGAIVLTASQPFTSALVMSNPKMFKYEWIWEKSNPANIACANIQPLKYHENICVFYKTQPNYNKQMIEREELGKKRLKNKNNPIRFSGSAIQNKIGVKKDYAIDRYDVELKNPSTVLKIKLERGKQHPTQKPVALFEYLIKTYTNEKDLVLDNTAGSGTTAIACLNTNRQFIVMEKEQKYFDIINKRVKEHNYINLFNCDKTVTNG